MAYKRVYAPNGEPFDVPEDRANNLVLNKGWTQTPVVILDEVLVEADSTPKSPKKSSKRKTTHEEVSEED